MPRKTRSVFGTQHLVHRLERDRRGSVDDFVSEWIPIENRTSVPAVPADDFNGKRSLRHRLGQVPMTVDVLKSNQSDGRNAEPVLDSEVTIEKDGLFITITNKITDDTGVGRQVYFQVRAR